MKCQEPGMVRLEATRRFCLYSGAHQGLQDALEHGRVSMLLSNNSDLMCEICLFPKGEAYIPSVNTFKLSNRFIVEMIYKSVGLWDEDLDAQVSFS